MGLHTFTRNASGPGFDIESPVAADIEAALPGKAFTVKCTATDVDVNFAVTLTAPEITTLTTAGFTYSSNQFSLSVEAQSKMTGAHGVRSDPALSYPIEWNTIDDLATISIATPAALDAFYLTGVGAARTHLDSGTALKDDVRAAATITAVEAVTDTR